jgi:hypothetical protein
VSFSSAFHLYGKVDVRGGTARVGNWLDGPEIVLTALPGQETPESLKAHIALLPVGATRMEVDALVVHLPDLDESVPYPDKLPFDADNDLLVINDGLTPAVGEVTHLSGRILDVRGDPIRGPLGLPRRRHERLGACAASHQGHHA